MKPTKRCLHCRTLFTPNPRTRGLQKFCSKPACQAQRQRNSFLKWCEKNPSYFASRAGKIRKWAKSHSYWKVYRKKNPSYIKLNRLSSKLQIREKREMFAKQMAIGGDPLRFLNAIRDQIARSKDFAKQMPIASVLDGILAYLISKECLQNKSLSTSNTPPRYDGKPLALKELWDKRKKPSSVNKP
jgi:hypothetical protein